MRKLLWGLSGAGSVIGGFMAVFLIPMATGAPQEAAAAAMACAFAIIPYVLARSWDELAR